MAHTVRSETTGGPVRRIRNPLDYPFTPVEPQRVGPIQRVATDVPVGAAGNSRKRVSRDELPCRRVVVPVPEVDEAGLGVGVLAGEAERGSDRARRPGEGSAEVVADLGGGASAAIGPRLGGAE